MPRPWKRPQPTATAHVGTAAARTPTQLVPDAANTRRGGHRRALGLHVLPDAGQLADAPAPRPPPRRPRVRVRGVPLFGGETVWGVFISGAGVSALFFLEKPPLSHQRPAINRPRGCSAPRGEGVRTHIPPPPGAVLMNTIDRRHFLQAGA